MSAAANPGRELLSPIWYRAFEKMSDQAPLVVGELFLLQGFFEQFLHSVGVIAELKAT
jgi:hypothetical protein